MSNNHSEDKTLKQELGGSNARLVERITVKPGEQPRILLGSFTAENSPKGFSIGLHPDPRPTGSVVTEVVNLGTPSQYKLILHIANNGTRATTAEVHQL